MFKKSGFENADKAVFASDGLWEIPKIKGFVFDIEDWQKKMGGVSIGFNYCKSHISKNIDCREKIINCCVDDYQLIRLWNRPDIYVEMLKKFKAVCSPDFSLYTDHPKALQLFNHYRKHWLGAYWESKDIKVIPTICWSDSSSFEWCFDGEPKEIIVAISTKGTQGNPLSKERFLAGYNQMLKRLNPIKILLFGNNPGGLDGDIVEMGYMSADMIKAAQMS
jgi:hypothetical protein